MEPSRDAEDDDLRPEYDLSQLKGGVRGKYAHRKRPEVPHGDGYETTAGFPSISLPVGSNGLLSHVEATGFLARMLTGLRPIFAKSVVPIGFSRAGIIGVCGTGTLFRVANVSFLVTASHIVVDAKTNGYQLSISDDVPGALCIPLHGRVLGHETYDVAVWELPSDVVAGLPNRSFLTVHHADRVSRRPANGTFYVHGYPSSLAGVDAADEKVTAVPFTFATGCYEGDTNLLPQYDPRRHILLDISYEGSQRLDGGKIPVPARFDGMSGCSIWQAYYKGLSAKHWTPDDAVVVAVQTGVYNNGTIVKGTRWWVVDRIIRECYPELAGPLSLVVPTA